jgi:hypothetical protein
MLKANKIYYAHHLWKYNTPIEEYELEVIKRYFSNVEIINPNGYIEQCREEAVIMKDCLKVIENCNILIFSSVNGVVGRGVVDEYNKASKLGLPIYYIMNDILYDARGYGFELTNSGNNRLYAIVIIK